MTCGTMTYEMNNLEIEVCVQPWCNPLLLTWLKASTNLRFNNNSNNNETLIKREPLEYTRVRRAVQEKNKKEKEKKKG